MSELFALDIETTGLNSFTDRILGIGVYSPRTHHFFTSVDFFTSWLSSCDAAPLFVMHRGAFDVNFLRRNGVDIRGSWWSDTRSIASILNPRPDSLGLEFLSEKFLGIAPYKLNRTDMSSYSMEEIKEYCLKDCKNTYDLYQLFLEKTKNDKFLTEWLQPATKFCADLEYDGVHIDHEGLTSYQQTASQKREEILKELKSLCAHALETFHEQQTNEVRIAYREMYEKAKEKAKDKDKCLERYQKLEEAAIEKLEPFNFNSPKQLVWLLRDYYGLEIKNREEEDSTAEAVLKANPHPICQKLCEYREVEKLVGTCIPALLENIQADGAVHSNYHIGGTRTGRLSSSNPNTQQIPRGPIRSYVRASDSSKVLLTIDYSQIEVRLIAHLAKESELINAFKEKIDPYSVIAQKLLKLECPVRDIKTRFKKERDVSKTAGLSILYGTGAGKLQEVLRKELNRDYSLKECNRFIADYRESLPGVKSFKLHVDRCLANGQMYKNLLGRPFSIDSNDDIYMKGFNTLVQGSASDLVMWSQTSFVIPKLKELDVDFTHRMIIHDEIVLELPEREAQLLTDQVIIPAMTSEIETALNLRVPLSVEYTIDKCWSKP